MNYFYYELLMGILMILSLLVPLNSKYMAFITSLFSMMFILYFDVLNYYNSWEMLMKSFCLLVGLMMLSTFKKEEIKTTGVLMMCVMLASMMLVSCYNTLMLYMCLEFQTLSLFVMMASKQKKITKVEASLKYFVLSSISSGLLLLGASLLFMKTGTCDINMLSYDSLSIEKVFLTAALLFKLACAPFHIWIPDVYQGCDSKSLLILGTLPKISMFSVLVMLMPSSKLILATIILSLLIGSMGALNQVKVFKMFAYSSILNMGFVLLGIATNSHSGVEASLLYLLFYMLSFTLFLLLINKLKVNNMSQLVGISSYKPVITITLGLLMLSIAGVPPLSGFFVKWMVLETAISFNFIISSIMSIMCAVMAGVYYLRLLKMSYFQDDKSFLVWKSMLLKENSNKELNSMFSSILFFLMFFMILCPHIAKELMQMGTMTIF